MTGLGKAGKWEQYNFLPRYVRWYTYVQRHKRYIYIFFALAACFSIASMISFVNHYIIYQDVESQFKAYKDNMAHQQVHAQYLRIQETIKKALGSHESYDTQATLITLLDGALSNSGTIRMQKITFSEDGFSINGIASGDDVYYTYLQYIQGHLQGWMCNGQQDTQQDHGFCSFRVEGHKQELHKATDPSSSGQ